MLVNCSRPAWPVAKVDLGARGDRYSVACCSARRLMSADMIPANWIPYLRAEDRELLGYLRPVDGSPGRFRPVTVFGYPLSGDANEHDAQRTLDSVGLSYLAGRWLLTIEGRPEPLAVEIVEASSEQLRVQNIDYGYEADFGKTFLLDVPTGDALRRP